MTQVMNSETSTAMGWGNRGSLDIMNYILLCCIEGKMMTHIMYMCNLNSKQTQSHLALMLKHRLLEKRETESFKNNVFRATALAGKYTDAYSELSGMFTVPTDADAPVPLE